MELRSKNIIVTGGKGRNIASGRFALSKDGWYVIKISYTGAEVSVCQLSLATQAMVAAKQTIGGVADELDRTKHD